MEEKGPSSISPTPSKPKIPGLSLADSPNSSSTSAPLHRRDQRRKSDVLTSSPSSPSSTSPSSPSSISPSSSLRRKSLDHRPRLDHPPFSSALPSSTPMIKGETTPIQKLEFVREGSHQNVTKRPPLPRLVLTREKEEGKREDEEDNSSPIPPPPPLPLLARAGVEEGEGQGGEGGKRERVLFKREEFGKGMEGFFFFFFFFF